MTFLQPDGSARRLWRFHGGLHLPDRKALSTGLPLAVAPLPARLTLPLQQHIGQAAKPLVGVGERVGKGQLIAQPQGYISAALHAPSSGVVTAIGTFPVPHPSGLSAPCIQIDTDGEDRWAELPDPISDWASFDPRLLRERIRWAGIVGLGGAAFPTNVKLSPGVGTPIHTLVLNGAECEPYISCDDLLMRERPERVIAGAAILMRLVGASQCLIGVEDNKPQAIDALFQEVNRRLIDGVRVIRIPTLYPSGSEKQLIHILTGQEVPTGRLPAQIGVVCHNVATASAVADAVLLGRPLISRILTLTGQGLANPRNWEVRIGTSAAELIALAGGYRAKVAKLLVGGPMMGFALPNDGVPITKAVNCLLALTPEESPDPSPVLPCIRCGRCAEVCPARLLPQQLYWYTRARELEKVQDLHLFDCIECGCCAQVCPSHIPLVQYYRFAKTESWAQEQVQRQADLARRRHEAREARLIRLEEERKAKLRKKTEALEGEGGSGSEEAKKAAIAAAVQRAAARKAALAAEGPAPQPRAQSQSATPAGAVSTEPPAGGGGG